MHIGEDQQEFEILPEEEQQPVVGPEPEPPRQPEDQQEFEILPEEEQSVVVPEHEPPRHPEDTPA